MSKRFSHTLPLGATERADIIPEPIKHIYQSVLADGRVLACERLDWMFPVGYKISIFDDGLQSIIDYKKNIVEINGRVSDYAIASYILQPGKITICPVENDKDK